MNSGIPLPKSMSRRDGEDPESHAQLQTQLAQLSAEKMLWKLEQGETHREKKRAQAIGEEHAQSAAKITLLEQQVAHLEASNRMHKEDKKKLKEFNEMGQQEADELATEMAMYMRENRDLTKTLNDLKREVDVISEDKEMAHAELVKAAIYSSNMKDDLKSREVEIQTLLHSQTNKDLEIQNMGLHIRDLEFLTGSLTAQNKNLEENQILEKLSSDYEASIGSLNTENLKLKSLIDNSTAENVKLATKNHDLQTVNTVLTTENVKLESSTASMKIEIQNHIEALETLSTNKLILELKDCHQELELMKNQLFGQNALVREYESNLALYESACAVAGSELAAILAINTENEVCIAHLKEQLNENGAALAVNAAAAVDLELRVQNGLVSNLELSSKLTNQQQICDQLLEREHKTLLDIQNDQKRFEILNQRLEAEQSLATNLNAELKSSQSLHIQEVECLRTINTELALKVQALEVIKSDLSEAVELLDSQATSELEKSSRLLENIVAKQQIDANSHDRSMLELESQLADKSIDLDKSLAENEQLQTNMCINSSAHSELKYELENVQARLQKTLSSRDIIESKLLVADNSLFQVTLENGKLLELTKSNFEAYETCKTKLNESTEYSSYLKVQFEELESKLNENLMQKETLFVSNTSMLENVRVTEDQIGDIQALMSEKEQQLTEFRRSNLGLVRDLDKAVSKIKEISDARDIALLNVKEAADVSREQNEQLMIENATMCDQAKGFASQIETIEKFISENENVAATMQGANLKLGLELEESIARNIEIMALHDIALRQSVEASAVLRVHNDKLVLENAIMSGQAKVFANQIEAIENFIGENENETSDLQEVNLKLARKFEESVANNAVNMAVLDKALLQSTQCVVDLRAHNDQLLAENASIRDQLNSFANQIEAHEKFILENEKEGIELQGVNSKLVRELEVSNDINAEIMAGCDLAALQSAESANALRAQNDQLLVENATMSDQAKVFVSQIERIEHFLTENETEAAHLHDVNLKLTLELEGSLARNIEIKVAHDIVLLKATEAFDILSLQKDQLAVENATMLDQINIFHQQVDEIQSFIVQNEDRSLHLQQLGEAKGELEAVSCKFDEIFAKNEQLVIENMGLSDENSKTQVQVVKLQSLHKNLICRLTESQSKNAVLEAQIEGNSMQIETLDNQATNYVKMIEDSNQKADSCRIQFNTEISELNLRLARSLEIEHKIGQKNLQISELQTILDSSVVDKGIQLKEVADLLESCTNLQHELGSKEQTLRQFQDLLSVQDSSIKGYIAQIDCKDLELGKIEAHILELETRAKELEVLQAERSSENVTIDKENHDILSAAYEQKIFELCQYVDILRVDAVSAGSRFDKLSDIHEASKLTTLSIQGILAETQIRLDTIILDHSLKCEELSKFHGTEVKALKMDIIETTENGFEVLKDTVNEGYVEVPDESLTEMVGVRTEMEAGQMRLGEDTENTASGLKTKTANPNKRRRTNKECKTQ